MTTVELPRLAQMPTNNRGGVATSSSAPQELPVLKKQPKRKAKNTAAIEAPDTRTGDAIEDMGEHLTQRKSHTSSIPQALPATKASRFYESLDFHFFAPEIKIAVRKGLGRNATMSQAPSMPRRKASISPSVVQLVDDVMRSRRPADALDHSQPNKKDLHL